jgi:DNA-binding CsgD family transcriptional regulator
VLAQLAGPSAPAVPFPDLTPRERQVLELLTAGLTTTAIGPRLGIAPKTVTNHTSAIFSKLQVQGRAEAVLRASIVPVARQNDDDQWQSMTTAVRHVARSTLRSDGCAGESDRFRKPMLYPLSYEGLQVDPSCVAGVTVLGPSLLRCRRRGAGS